MAEYFDVDFEDYVIFHRGIRNIYTTDENDENPLHLHVVYQDGMDVDVGNPYGNYVNEARTASTDAFASAEDAKRWAVGRNLDGTPVPGNDETYENNSKYYAEITSEKAEQAEELLYGTRNGIPVSGKIHDNIVYYYQETRNDAGQFDGLGSRVHYTGTCESAANESNKVVLLEDGYGSAVSSFELANGTHLFVDFTNDNTASNVQLTVGSYTLPVLFSGDNVNYDKLCGICEFAVKRVSNGYACTFIHSNKYEPVIYAVGSLPATGKLGQLCVVKKESD